MGDEGCPVVAVVGSGAADAAEQEAAELIGRGLGAAGVILLSGGLGGVMEAACRGAKAAGGRTVGLLPGMERSEGNAFLDVAIPTGLGEARNVLVVRAADAVIAVGGEYGTLSEIALALKAGTPVVGLATWQLQRGGAIDTGIHVVASADAAWRKALALARDRLMSAPATAERKGTRSLTPPPESRTT